ncbi:HAMP domain-containing histidine kinase [Nitratiruptor tergarcus]|uniref:HAMP domain-containing histidine kinase n=1 Tax=Nitratiruptor tergarcus TaxID=269259 RepID=UPI000A043D52|nr:HAMP domain-containing histidine kinase [Nitratiruptor tergarcus]
MLKNRTLPKKSKERFEQILSRLDLLLREFAKVERVTLDEFTLNPKEFRVVDLFDHVLDLLMVDLSKIDIYIEGNEIILADFEMFSVALKNLIDNALRYSSSKPKIVVRGKKISIISTGEPLDTQMFKNNSIENLKRAREDWDLESISQKV